jgi:FG-GAP-like repeat
MKAPLFRSSSKFLALSLLLSLFLFSTLGFSQTSNPVPLINNPLVPTAVAPGGPSFTLTVNGTGFVPSSVVYWNGSPRSTTYVSGSKLTATIFATDIATPNTGSVTVVSPSPGGGTSNVIFLSVTVATSSVFMASTDYVGCCGGFAGDIISADLNGDGKLDVAYTNSLSYGFSVLLGNGDGTFQPDIVSATSNDPSLITAGDFNGDGKPDVALSHFTDSIVQVLLGNGDGTFNAPTDYSTAYRSTNIENADFNGDGNLDLPKATMLDRTQSPSS